MSSKTFGLFAFSIFALVLVLGMASAAIVLNPNTKSVNLSQGNSDSFTFTINNTDATSTYSNFSAVTSNLVSGSNTLAPSNIVVGTLPSTLTAGNTSSAITVTVNVPSNQATGTYTGNITIDADGSTTNPNAQTLALTIIVNPSTSLSESSICSDAGSTTVSSANLNVDIRDITIVDGFGDNEEWLLFDEVEFEIRVENNGDFDIDDISVEWAIANDDLSDFAVDFDEVDEISLKDGDEDTLIVSFKVDDDDLDMDLDELSGLDYNLVVRATGVIDDPDNGQFDGDETCAANFEAISIQDESDFVILTNFDIPETVQCGTTVTIKADVWNIGDSQQDEVSVDVFDRDKKLVNDIFEVGDIDEFDNTEFSFNIEIPSDAEEKTYVLTFRVLDEDNDVYENNFDDDPAEFIVPLSVSGGCGGAGTGNEVSVSANIASGGRAGQDLVVKATITNNENSQKNYALNVAGYEDWASSFSLDKTVLNLNAGQSADVLVTLDVNDDSEGSRTFFLEFLSDGELVRQPVTLSVGESRGSGITGFVTGDNWYLWGIGLLNVVLVIVIILVAIRIARK